MVWASIRDPYMRSRESEARACWVRMIGPGESSYTRYDADVTARAEAWLDDADHDTAIRLCSSGSWRHTFRSSSPSASSVCIRRMQMPEPKFGIHTDYVRHPWIQEYFAFSRIEEQFESEDERRAAISAYHGLVHLDGRERRANHRLRSSEAGLADANTHVIYTSDHGDNVGARGVWGKSNLYEESVRVPMLLAGPDLAAGVCDTPVDLLDLYPTILQAMGVDGGDDGVARPGRSLFEVAAEPEDAARGIFSEYHAAGSNTGAFMWRQHGFKLIEYVRHEPEGLGRSCSAPR